MFSETKRLDGGWACLKALFNVFEKGVKLFPFTPLSKGSFNTGGSTSCVWLVSLSCRGL